MMTDLTVFLKQDLTLWSDALQLLSLQPLPHQLVCVFNRTSRFSKQPSVTQYYPVLGPLLRSVTFASGVLEVLGLNSPSSLLGGFQAAAKLVISTNSSKCELQEGDCDEMSCQAVVGVTWLC